MRARSVLMSKVGLLPAMTPAASRRWVGRDAGWWQPETTTTDREAAEMCNAALFLVGKFVALAILLTLTMATAPQT